MKKIAWITGIIFVLALGTVYFVGLTDRGHTFFHGLIFGHDQIYAHGRVYSKPITMTADVVDKQFVQKSPAGEKKLIPTGESFIGYPAFDTPDAIDKQTRNQIPSDHLLLKKTDGIFLVFYLQPAKHE